MIITKGIQNKILRQIISHIKKQPNKTFVIDIPIAILAKRINSSKDSIKVSIKRLQKKNLIILLPGERGRYGRTKIKIPEIVVKKYFNLFDDPACNIDDYRNNTGTIQEQYKNKYVNNNNSSSSSSSNIIKTTTTKSSLLLSKWLYLDIEPLTSIGFNQSHLSQIASQNKLSLEVIQNSIYAFAFDLENNDKAKSIKGDLINFFMGILKKGPYLTPSNYESPQDKAMRLYHARMKKIQQERDIIEKESKGLAYKDWFSKLGDDEKRKFLPQNLRCNARLENNKMLEGAARNHFENEIWSNKKKEILQKSKID